MDRGGAFASDWSIKYLVLHRIEGQPTLKLRIPSSVLNPEWIHFENVKSTQTSKAGCRSHSLVF